MTHGTSRGVTLIELVVALAVSGIVLLAAHASLGVVVHGWQSARAARRTSAGGSARLVLADWLRAAVLSDSDATFVGRSAFRDGRESDTVRFIVSDGGALYPGPRRVTLWVRDDPGALPRGLLAVLAPWPPARGAATIDTLVLAPDARALSARYLVAPKGREAWVDDWASRTELPRAVAVRVDVPPDRGVASAMSPGDAILSLPLVVSIAASRW